MKIALITDGMWPYVIGGMQKHSYYLCKYMVRNGVEVDLVHFNQSDYKIEDLGFFSEEEKKLIRATVIKFPTSFRFPGHYIYNSIRYSSLVYESIREQIKDYDFIYCKGFSAWTLIRKKRLKPSKFPPIGVNFHGYEMFQQSPDRKAWFQNIMLLRWPVKYISKHADAVFSYGGKITSLIESIGVDRKKIIELPSGVESSVIVPNIRPTGRTLRFLFLGRYERRKGLEELNDALTKLVNSDTRRKFEMHFIGPIPEELKVENKKVFYLGEIRDKEKLNQLIRCCDILLCPSWSEGFPNVILEAMANGLTVIATDVGAISTLVNNGNGYILKDSQAENIETVLLNLLASEPKTIDKKKQAALDTIRQKFTWEVLSKELLSKIVDFTNQYKQTQTVN